MIKVLFYVDHAAENAKRTEIGVETLQCVKVVNVISIAVLSINDMAFRGNCCKCRKVISNVI